MDAKEIYYQDTTHYIFDNSNNLIKKYKSGGEDEFSLEYDKTGRLITIVRILRMGRQPAQSSKYLLKYDKGQISNVIIYQFSGPKVSLKYYYDETNHLVKNELFIDDKLMSFMSINMKSINQNGMRCVPPSISKSAILNNISVYHFGVRMVVTKLKNGKVIACPKCVDIN